MEFPFEIISATEDDTASLAKKFSKELARGSIVLLDGELGTGKTFFVKQICSEFGIANVSSPSFAIVNEYQNSKKVIHFDFYRIKKSGELFDIGLEDYLSDTESIIFIEWAELFPEILPKKNYQVEFSFVNNTTRRIIIKKNG